MDGICRICSVQGPLSFEHVPPESCFNDQSVKYFQGPQAVKFHFNGKAKYTPFQRGHGGYTLCGKCNSDTGSWYGADYARFIGRVGEVWDFSYFNKKINFHFGLAPLSVLKQIIVMMLSVNDFSNFDTAKGLREFVLDKNSNAFPANVKVYICIDKGNVSRFIGNAAMMSLDGPSVHLSDMAFWPLGITMCIDGDLPDKGMKEITHWFSYGYAEHANLFLDLPVLNGFTHYPGVYLTHSVFEKMNKKSSNESLHRTAN